VGLVTFGIMKHKSNDCKQMEKHPFKNNILPNIFLSGESFIKFRPISSGVNVIEGI